MRVLLAFDGSPSAAAAIRAAGTLFAGAEAVVLTVRPQPLDLESAASARIGLPDAVIRKSLGPLNAAAQAEAQETAAAGVAAAAEAGLDAAPRIEAHGGSPWRGIRDVAAEEDADVVVCGTRGMGAASRLTLGSTSTALLHRAGRPVLVVPETGGDAGGPAVLGYDGSDSAKEAVAAAGRLLAGRELLVVNAWESPIRHSLSGRALASVPLDEVRELTGDLEAYFRSVAEDIAAEGAALAGEAVPSRAVEARGPAWHGVLAAAREAGAAVVVAGSRGRGGLAAGLLGSVSNGLAHEAELPVLVVPHES